MRTFLSLAGLSLLTVATVSACTGEPAALQEMPSLRVTSPERGTIRGQLGTIEVRGQATGPIDSGAAIVSVEVNGVPAIMGADGGFVATIPARAGATLIHTVATDAAGGTATDTRTMLAGATTTSDAMIADSITTAISAQAFTKMGEAAAGILADTDIKALVAPMNPVLVAGLDNGEEDCLWIKGNVTGFDFVAPQIRLIPFAGGLRLEADFYDLHVPLDARYEFSCVDGNDTLDIRADRVSIAGDLLIWAENGALKVNLENADIDTAGLDFDGSGVPGAVLDLFFVDDLVEWALELGVESFMEPTVNKMLAGIGVVSQQLNVMGHDINIVVMPEDISFDSSGARVRLDSSFSVAGAEDGPGFVYTENTLPTMSTASGFELALADDAANQLLAGFWAVGGMKIAMPLAAGAFDAIESDPLLPPTISADPGNGALRMLVGDMGIKFLKDGVVKGEVVLNLVMDLQIDTTGGAVTLRPGTPVMYVDYLDGVLNDTGFANTDLAAMLPTAIQFEMDKLLPLLAAIPLPTIGGVGVTDLSIIGKGGYLTISGGLQ